MWNHNHYKIYSFLKESVITKRSISKLLLQSLPMSISMSSSSLLSLLQSMLFFLMEKSAQIQMPSPSDRGLLVKRSCFLRKSRLHTLKHLHWDEVDMIPEVACLSPSMAIVLHVPMTKRYRIGRHTDLSQRVVVSETLLIPLKIVTYTCEPPQIRSISPSAPLMTTKYPGGGFLDNWKLLWPHCTQQSSTGSRHRCPRLGVYIGCWKEASKFITGPNSPDLSPVVHGAFLSTLSLSPM